MAELPVFKFALRPDVIEDKRFLPTKAEPLATGYDVRACPADHKDIIVRPGEVVRIPLGFRAFCPSGWWYILHPRSSFFVKKNMHTLIGIIDEAFPEQAQMISQYLPDAKDLTKNLIIKYGDAIGQIIPVRREEMRCDEITNKDMDDAYIFRGAARTGGFGSTDKIGFYKTGKE